MPFLYLFVCGVVCGGVSIQDPGYPETRNSDLFLDFHVSIHCYP